MVDDLVEFAGRWRPDLVIWDALTFAGPVVALSCGAAHARLLFGMDYISRMYGFYTDLLRRQPLAEPSSLLFGGLPPFGLPALNAGLDDVPVTYRPEALGRGATMPFAWDLRHPARVGVVPRGSGDVRWFEVTPCFVSHTLNAYEEDGLLVVDVVTRPDGFDIAAMRADGYGALDRWTIDLRAGTLHEQRLDDRPQEFPRVGESMVSRRHRYGYSAATAALYRRYVPFEGPPPDAAFDNALIKHDLLRGTSELHRFGRDAAVGEAVFVPAGAPPALPAADGEDDGYLLAYVHSPERGAADLVILSAQDFTGAPLARVHLPRRIPLGLHGSWLPDS